MAISDYTDPSAIWSEGTAIQNPQDKLRWALRWADYFKDYDKDWSKRFLEIAQELLITVDNATPYHAFVYKTLFNIALLRTDIDVLQSTTQPLLQFFEAHRDWKTNYSVLYALGGIAHNIAMMLQLPAAYQQALEYFIAASNLLNIHPQASMNLRRSHFVLMARMGDCAAGMGENERAACYLRAADILATDLTLDRDYPLVAVFSCHFYVRQQAFEKAHYHATRCLSSSVPSTVGVAYETLAHVFQAENDWNNALAYRQKALEIADKMQFDTWTLRLLPPQIRALYGCQQYNQAIQQTMFLLDLQDKTRPFFQALYTFWATLSSHYTLHAPYTAPLLSLRASPSLLPADRSFVEELNRVIRTHYHDVNFGVESLAQYLQITPRTLQRKVHELLHDSPLQLIRQTRLQAAQYLLSEHKNCAIADIAHRTGFRSAAYFTKIFREVFGKTPGDFK